MLWEPHTSGSRLCNGKSRCQSNQLSFTVQFACLGPKETLECYLLVSNWELWQPQCSAFTAQPHKPTAEQYSPLQLLLLCPHGGLSFFVSKQPTFSAIAMTLYFPMRRSPTLKKIALMHFCKIMHLPPSQPFHLFWTVFIIFLPGNEEWGGGAVFFWDRRVMQSKLFLFWPCKLSGPLWNKDSNASNIASESISAPAASHSLDMGWGEVGAKYLCIRPSSL